MIHLEQISDFCDQVAMTVGYCSCNYFQRIKTIWSEYTNNTDRRKDGRRVTALFKASRCNKKYGDHVMSTLLS